MNSSKQYLEEGKLTFQKKISSLVVEHSIPKELIINVDQIPLSHFTRNIYTWDLRGAKTVPVKGIDDKRQITTIFYISISGKVLPIQVIFSGNTKR